MEASKALAAEAQVWLKAYNETKFFENIQVLLNEKQNQKLSFGAHFRLFIVNASMQCVEAINRIILKTKSEFLRKNILEWRVS
jgi:F0F1-type ATP synthase alpha subunit